MFDLLSLRFFAGSAAGAPHSTQPPPRGTVASCSKDRGWWRAWHAQQLGRDRDGPVHRVIQRSLGRAPPGRATRPQGSAAAAPKLGDASVAALGVDLGARAAWRTTTPFHPVRNASRVERGYPECKRPADLGNMLRAGRISARGWETSDSKGLTASARGSTLEIPFLCSRDGSGLTLALTQSYQPLGLLDAYVDDTLVSGKLSCRLLHTLRALWTCCRLLVKPAPTCLPFTALMR